MRDLKSIRRNIEDLQYEIRLARLENDSDVELLYRDLDELQEEYYAVQTYERQLSTLSGVEV